MSIRLVKVLNVYYNEHLIKYAESEPTVQKDEQNDFFQA